LGVTEEWRIDAAGGVFLDRRFDWGLENWLLSFMLEVDLMYLGL
jgi:hypothetical protein